MTGQALPIILTFKTLLAVALFLLTWAVVSIRDTFMIVAVGIFLGLVFEALVRFVERHTPLGRGTSATVTVIGILVAVTLLALAFLKPLLEGLQSFLKDLPVRSSSSCAAGRARLRRRYGRRRQRPVGSAERLGCGAGRARSARRVRRVDRVRGSLRVPDHLHLPVLPLRGGRISSARSRMLLPKRQEEVWLPLWDRITTMVSRWAIGVVVIATIAGTTQGLTAYLLGSSYAGRAGLIAGLLDMIPNIGATIAGFILVPTLLAEEGVTAAPIMLAGAGLPADREQRDHPDDPGRRSSSPRSSSSWLSRSSARCSA